MSVFGVLIVLMGISGAVGLAQAQEEPDLPEPDAPIIIPPAAETEPAPIEPEIIDPLSPIIIQPLQTSELFPVVVQFRTEVGYQSEGRLTNREAIVQQRAAIRRTQDTLLRDLNWINARTRNIHRYQTIPYMALHVDSAGLGILQNHSEVMAVVEDQVRELYTYYSNPVVGAPDVWDRGYRGEGYAVAILDTGVSSLHPMFPDGKIIEEACYGTNSGVSFVSACPGGQSEVIGVGAAEPADCNGCYHGTHVAGIAAGNGGDVSGFIGEPGPIPVEGAAPGASIIAVNVFSLNTVVNRPGAFDSDVLAGLEYVYRLATDGPDGIPNNGDEIAIASANMSLGGGRSMEVCDGESDPGYVAIAAQLASRNIATVAATGNDGYKDSLGFPACYSNVIGVGAITVEASDPAGLAGDDLTVAYFSNGNAFVDLFAPGFFVTSGVPVGTGPGGSDYRRLSGTSMASPYVAGGWAIMRQRFPNASPDDILAQLSQTGIQITDNGQSTAFGSSTGSGFTHPLIQLDEAVDLAEPVLISPLTITLDLRPSFFWQEMPLTDAYDITVHELETDELVAVASDFTGCNAGQCAVASGVNLVNNRRYYWTVQGKNNDGLVSPIARADFVVRSATPDGDIITDTPDFVFERTPGDTITAYDLEVIDRDNNDTVIFSGAFSAENVCDLTICIINPQVNLAQVIGDKNLAWRFRAFNSATSSYSAWTTYKNFTVLSPIVSAPTGTINTPDGRPVYAVSRITDGESTPDWYRFYVVARDTNQFVADNWVNIAEGTCDETTCQLSPETLLYDGTYVVYVNAYTSGKGRSAWSAGREFTLDAPAPRTSFLELTNIFEKPADFIVDPLTSTVDSLTNTLIPCGDDNGQPTCSSSRPYFQITYNVGGFSGEWLELVLFAPSTREVPYQQWVNVNDTDALDNVTCDPAPLTSTAIAASCIIQTPSYLQNGQYQWYVRSWGAGGPSQGGVAGYTQPDNASEGDPNNIANFAIGAPNAPVTGLTATVGAPSRVTTMTPTIIGGEVEFSWQPVLSAEWYEISVADNTGELLSEAWYQVGQEIVCAPDCKIVLDDAFFVNGTYQWRVRYWNGTVSQPSATRNFTVALSSIVTPPVSDLVVFTNETVAGNTRPRYQWPQMQNATWYRLSVENSTGDTVVNQWYRAIDMCSTQGCTVQPDVDLIAGQHTWSLQPWGPAGFGNSVGGAAFTVSNQQTGQAIPVDPVGNVLVTSEPTFTWQRAANASWYQLYVINQATDVVLLDTWFYLPEEACTRLVENNRVCDVAPGLRLPNGTSYAWRIRAYGPSGLTDWTTLFGDSVFEFSVSAPLSQIPALYAPINSTLVSEAPTFEWEEVGAEYYRLEITNLSGNVVFSQWYPAAEIPCSEQRCRLHLEQTLRSGTYRWTIATWQISNGSEIRSSGQAVFIRL